MPTETPLTPLPEIGVCPVADAVAFGLDMPPVPVGFSIDPTLVLIVLIPCTSPAEDIESAVNEAAPEAAVSSPVWPPIITGVDSDDTCEVVLAAAMVELAAVTMGGEALVVEGEGPGGKGGYDAVVDEDEAWPYSEVSRRASPQPHLGMRASGLLAWASGPQPPRPG